MNELIPLLPADGLVTAVTTNTSPIPACVMKRFEPLRRYTSPRRTAVVRVPPASLPAPSSVSPKPPSTRPLASGGTYRSRCASVPKFMIGDVPSVVCAEIVIECDASTFAISWIAMMNDMRSHPEPPSARGHGMPSRPRSAICLTVAHGKVASASCLRAIGATTSRANSRTLARISFVLFREVRKIAVCHAASVSSDSRITASIFSP